MKILHIINNLNAGGAQNLAKEALPIMKSKGINVDILLLNINNNVFYEDLSDCGINILSTKCSNVYSIKQISCIKDYLINNDYDLVHVHLFPAFYWAVGARKLARSSVPIVYTEHNTFNKRRKYFFLKPIENYVYKNYEKIICISDSTKEEVLKWSSIAKDKVVTVCNGINLERFENAQSYFKTDLLPNVENNTIFVLMVGSMTPQKDQESLVKAMKFLSSKFHLILVGEGPLSLELKKLSERLNIQDRVHFLGVRNDVPEIMKTSDIFVLSSKWEGFGLVAVEAMASGLPIIGSNVEGLSSVIGESGFLFEVGDINELSTLIKKTCENPKTYQNMVNKGIMQARQYSIEKMVDNYLEIYKNVLSK